MRLPEFERRAWTYWGEIPEEYKEGVDGLVISPKAEPHPAIPDIYTLGECATESYPSDYGGPDTIRSVVVLYHGSFSRLAELGEAFDWEEELWETLTHELRHHLESLAAEDALEGVDYAADQNFKRLEGEDFDPWFYRSGEPIGGGVFQVEREFFIEREYDDGAPPSHVEFHWRGADYRVPCPPDPGDVAFLWVEDGLDPEREEVTVVLVRRRGAWAALRRMLRRGSTGIVHHDVRAERVG